MDLGLTWTWASNTIIIKNFYPFTFWEAASKMLTLESKKKTIYFELDMRYSIIAYFSNHALWGCLPCSSVAWEDDPPIMNTLLYRNISFHTNRAAQIKIPIGLIKNERIIPNLLLGDAVWVDESVCCSLMRSWSFLITIFYFFFMVASLYLICSFSFRALISSWWDPQFFFIWRYYSLFVSMIRAEMYQRQGRGRRRYPGWWDCLLFLWRRLVAVGHLLFHFQLWSPSHKLHQVWLRTRQILHGLRILNQFSGKHRYSKLRLCCQFWYWRPSCLNFRNTSVIASEGYFCEFEDKSMGTRLYWKFISHLRICMPLEHEDFLIHSKPTPCLSIYTWFQHRLLRCRSDSQHQLTSRWQD